MPEPATSFYDIGEELAIFDPLTWQTHLLNRTATEIVYAVQDGADTAKEIAEIIAPGNATFRQEVESLLTALSNLGLVKRVED